ncbi:MAG: DUF4350 domain-containing protein [Bdellovibrionales bacterium]|nr:DUF4350 domain-containing protein [Bdellovibrionales bacterium]
MNRRLTTLLLLLIVSLLIAQFTADTNVGSSYSAKGYGTRALYLYLERAGYTVQPWLHPFEKLDHQEQGAVLVVVSPSKQFRALELDEWLRKGNTLVFFAPPSQLPLELLDIKSLRVAESETLWFQALAPPEVAAPVQCSPDVREICEGVREASDVGIEFTATGAAVPAAVSTAKGALALHSKVGDGHVWLVPNAALLQNDHIDRHDNLRLLFQLLTRHGDRIYFDEFHHGFIAPIAAAHRHRGAALWLLVGTITTILVIVVLSRSIRFGPPHPVQSRADVTSDELSTALGLLYLEHAATGVLVNYVGAWRERLARRFGISPRIAAEHFFDQLKASVPLLDRARLEKGLHTLQSGAPLSGQELEQYILEMEQIAGGRLQ